MQVGGYTAQQGPDIHERARGSNWMLIGAASVSTDDPATEPQTQYCELRASSALKVRVREAMSVAHWGEPDTAYERQMARLQLHGLELGTKYRSPHFVLSAEHLAAVASQARTADALNRNLASLGIPSDLNLIFDGVSIGASSSFLAAPSSGLKHAGDEQVASVSQALCEHPGR